MKTTETVEEFYKNRDIPYSNKLDQDATHYNVFTLEDHGFTSPSPAKYCRRDFYKISLIRGNNRCHYADKSIEISGSTLMFFNPQVPYTWEPLSDETGYFCIFKEAFILEGLRGNIKEFLMFTVGCKPSYSLTSEQDNEVRAIFQKMIQENNSDYRFKQDLARMYVLELIHFALKLEPLEILFQHANANARLTSIFTELLERQFPIESPQNKFGLRSAKDFADHLAIHVNQLNRAVRETTGKTTTEHITGRLTEEARILLKHTNWNVSEIGYALGFEEQAHFYNFFKKNTSVSPTAFWAASK